MRTFPYYIRSRQLLWGPKLNRAKNPWDRLFCLWLLIQYYNKETNLSLWVVGKGFGWLKVGGRVLFSCHNSKTKARYLSTICEGTILCQEFRKVVIGGTGAIVPLTRSGQQSANTGLFVSYSQGSVKWIEDVLVGEKKVRVTVIHAS